jgi:hypothetical protein
MEIAVQAGNLPQLKEALGSTCQRVRFGSEFCMYALPTAENLKTAYEAVTDAGKGFAYVTPRLADLGMDKVREHLVLLNDLGDASVVANDLGTLHVLRGLSNLKPHLGRQLVYTPSRCPWKEITEEVASIFVKRKVKRIFYQTALNYGPTVEFFKALGVLGADVDWIPDLFEGLNFLSRNGLRVSVHLHAVPAAITRKCHSARFLGEESLERCSRPCYTRAYSMENDTLKTSLFLHGNAVFRLKEPERKALGRLKEGGVAELVLDMGPLTGIRSHAQIESLVRSLRT